MRQNSLAVNKGLSLSEAQSVSNLCNQRANEIVAKFDGVNNAGKTIKIDSNDQVIVVGNSLPNNTVTLILEKSRLHACQAFLMENLKAKDLMIRNTKLRQPDVSDIPKPIQPQYAMVDTLGEVTEEWGWQQLSVKEINEFTLVNTYAAHIGKFIHLGGSLSNLRTELPQLPCIEWMEVEKDKKTPVIVNKHHTSEQLFKLHEELATQHREYEKRVNYFKAKVKNLVTLENARIAKLNADEHTRVEQLNSKLRAEYNTAVSEYSDKVATKKKELAIETQEDIKRIASMRIVVADEFKGVVDEFLTKLNK